MIILVMGLPGSGKSYFASRFAERIHAGYINSDRIRRQRFPPSSYTEKEKTAVYDEMLDAMRQAVRQDKDLVLDATFYRDDIRRRFIDEAGGDIVLMEVAAEEGVIKKRLMQKRTGSDADFEVYKRIKAQWEPLHGHRLILTSSDHNIEDMLREAVGYLKLRNDKPAYC